MRVREAVYGLDPQFIRVVTVDTEAFGADNRDRGDEIKFKDLKSYTVKRISGRYQECIAEYKKGTAITQRYTHRGRPIPLESEASPVGRSIPPKRDELRIAQQVPVRLVAFSMA